MARFISFRDRQACERVRRIRRDELADARRIRSSGSRSSTNRAEFYRAFADDLVGRIRRARDEGRQFVAILPVGPDAAVRARGARDQRGAALAARTSTRSTWTSTRTRTASPRPCRWPGSFQRAMLRAFFALHRSPSCGRRTSQIHFPTTDAIADYSERIEDARRRRRLLRRHRLVRPHRLLGVAPRARSSPAISTPTSRPAPASSSCTR